MTLGLEKREDGESSVTHLGSRDLDLRGGGMNKPVSRSVERNSQMELTAAIKVKSHC